MKYIIAVAALVALVYSQETPDQRREQFVNDMWNISSENGCLTRQTVQDLVNVLDDNEDKKVTQEEFVAVVGIALGDKPATCIYNAFAAIGGNPVTIPDGVNKIFDSVGANGDCLSETTFKQKATLRLKECRWPEDEDAN